MYIDTHARFPLLSRNISSLKIFGIKRDTEFYGGIQMMYDQMVHDFPQEIQKAWNKLNQKDISDVRYKENHKVIYEERK